MVFGFADSGFRPDDDIPDLSGKVILVTGGNLNLLGTPCSIVGPTQTRQKKIKTTIILIDINRIN
jgi:hypothetical protein